MDSQKDKCVALDTNVWIAIALSIYRGKFSTAAFALFEALGARLLVPVMSDATFRELGHNLSKPELGLRGAFIISFLELIEDLCVWIPVRGLDMGCRDDSDDKFVELAYNGQCELLITRDKDLTAYPVPDILTDRGCNVCGVSEALSRITDPVK